MLQLAFAVAGFACIVLLYYFPANFYVLLCGTSVLLLVIVLAWLNMTSPPAPAVQTTKRQIYRDLVESAGITVFTTDQSGHFSFVGSQAEALTGYSPAELEGRDFSFLLHPAWINQVFAFYNNQISSRIAATTFEFIIRTKSGQQKWVEQSAQLIFTDNHISGFQCMVKDITTKKRTELELKESELKRKETQHRLDSIINHATSLIFIKDLDGRYVMANKKFKEVFRVTDKDIIDKTDYSFNSEALADHYKTLDNQVIATKQSVESVEQINTPEGKMSLLLVKFPLLNQDKSIFGIGAIATDITDRTEYQQQLIEAKKSAEAARMKQEHFLSNMSREILSPVNNIQNMSNHLLEMSLPADQKETVLHIKRTVASLAGMVNDVIEFSKIRNGKIIIEKTAFNIEKVLEEILQQQLPVAREKGLLLETQTDHKIPSILIGDPQHLKKVLLNIVSNGLRFTENGMVKIHVSLLQKTKHAVVIQFAISDTGIGIPEDRIHDIFESFAQEDGNISRRHGGAGLGLAISKSLLQLQGGDISVKSRPGYGSVFTFHIPYGIKIRIDSLSPELDPAVLLKGKRFLVVEDNEVNQKFLRVILKKVDAFADVAANGKEAIAYYESGNSYDAVIMDIQMPVMDGYETAAYIRNTLRLQVPILATTATTTREVIDKCIESGMNDCMTKPFEFDHLYHRLIRLLYKSSMPNPMSGENNNEPKLYSLDLFDGLDDPESLLDVISIFLEDAPLQVKDLTEFCQQGDFSAIVKAAHKLKGAIAMLQADPITSLLVKIEAAAKEGKDIEPIREDAARVAGLFAQLEKQLKEESLQIRNGNR